MADKKGGFTILLWNGDYDDANFVVKDNTSGKLTYFNPEKPKDVAWTSSDLTSDPSVKGWEEFGNEHVEALDDIIF